MNESFEKLFDPEGEPIRRNAFFRASRDASGNPVLEAVEGDAITLSRSGSIDQAGVVGFLHCGHSALEGIGGQCGEPECSNVSCKRCFAQSRCSLCFTGICLEHLRKLATEKGELNLCHRCQAELIRKRHWRGFVNALISPFVERSEP